MGVFGSKKSLGETGLVVEENWKRKCSRFYFKFWFCYVLVCVLFFVYYSSGTGFLYYILGKYRVSILRVTFFFNFVCIYFIYVFILWIFSVRDIVVVSL